MRYLCLVYQDDSLLQNRTKEEMEKTNAENWAFAEVFQDSGQLIVEYRLQPPHMATIVRVREGKTLTTDGPFADTKEQLVGVYLIEAGDLSEAIRVTSKSPSARLGSIEVRPIYTSY